MTLNPGMARWLRFRIASLTGVSFGWEFPFPGALFKRLLSGFQPDHERSGAFDENRVRWELFDLLREVENDERFARLIRYCEAGPARRLQLANRLAWLFDQYLLYRPDAIVNWEAGAQSQDWQAELWRRLLGRLSPSKSRPKHIARIWNDLRLSPTESIAPNQENWPDRISIFGVSSLPPLYMDLLEAISHWVPVHLFLLQPSDLYWADLKTRKQLVKAANRSSKPSDTLDLDDQPLEFEIGNPLLPSLGKQGQAFLDLIIDRDPIHDDSAFVEPESTTQLQCLQADLLALRHRSSRADSDCPFPDYDETIQIHSASTPRREVESLWDYLRDYFERNPNAEASDLLVMAPDIQDYSSHIESVFGSEERSETNIPFSIADQSGILESAFLSGALSYLKFASERASATQALALLKLPITRDAFSFSEEEIQCLEFWIRETKTIWGWDANHRQRHHAFPTDRCSWKEFRERIAAGIAYRSDNLLIDDRFSPFPEIEGEGARLAGRFAAWLEFLESLSLDTIRDDSIAAWNQRLSFVLDRLKPMEEIEERRFFKAIEAIQEALPSDCPVIASGREAISIAIQALESHAPASGYLSGRVTFCSLKPMRSIPAKVICLLGMNSERYPRKSIRPPFDLLSIEPRRGDRNTRDEDKQFFLETLLSARERLYISYQGISPVAESIREPSTVVSELMDYLETATSSQAPFPVVIHKRQSYDPEYFSNGNLFTYSRDRATQCRAYLGQPAVAPQNTENATAPQSSVAGVVAIESLLRFFKNPQLSFARSTLEIAFPENDERLADSDPLHQDPLARYQLRERFAEALRSGHPIDSVDERLIASRKLLPPGHLETLSYETIRSQALAIEESWNADQVSGASDLIDVECAVGPWTIVGSIRRNLSDSGQRFIVPGKLTAKARIATWIHHLIANALSPTQSIIHSLDEGEPMIDIPAMEFPKEELHTLLDLFQQGLNQPLPFFPQLSWDALTQLNRKPESTWQSDPLGTFAAKSQQLFRKQSVGSTYSKYPWNEYDSVCFGDGPPLDESYSRISLAIWQPYFDAIERTTR